MKKLILIFAIAFFALSQSSAQFYNTSTGFVGFYSKTPLEDVKAEANNVRAVINISKNELAFIIINTSFNFPNKLMQEHFNEKYIESEKYPQSSFKGKINDAVDLAKDGEYKVTVTGKLNIHGVEKERTIAGQIIVKDGKIGLKSNFKIKPADHKVEIPKLVMQKLAEEMDVTVDALLIPKK